MRTRLYILHILMTILGLALIAVSWSRARASSPAPILMADADQPKRLLHRYTAYQSGTGAYKTDAFTMIGDCARFTSEPKHREITLCGTFSIIQNLRPDEDSEDEDQEPGENP